MKQKKNIAVVGMAGIFPGASDLDTFWQNIIHKKDSCREVPKDRWIADLDAMYHPSPAPDKAFSKRACLIHDFTFDPKGIDLDPDLLTALDPLYQIVLHAGRDAFSSCTSLSLADKKRIGVSLAAIALPTDASSAITRKILGHSFEEHLFPNQKKRVSELSQTECLSSRVTSLPGAILARGLGLGGGSFTLDAACASSLYAVKLACDELQSSRADVMLAGGVSRPECLYTQVGFSQLRALSRSGRCAPFDETADGLVVGEGAGILVLKRLDHALRDGDSIYAVIRGIGLSNDMRGNLLAPDSEGQVRAMQSAYESAGWSPYDVDMIECHGAGTPVGDATELRSLRKLWGDSGWSPKQCAIGSIKSMIGHLLTGAGAAGMIKTLLGLHHKTLPPSLNFRKASAKSPLNDGPFRVQTEAEEWSRRDAETPRRAAVSAFGFGGINAHLLFETFDGAASSTDDSETSELEIRDEARPDVAIVGMDAKFGLLTSLREFQEAIFRGDTAIRKRPETRWKGSDTVAEQYLGDKAASGGYLDDLAVHIGDFRIPPNEIPDILPQQLLMLQVSAKAMADAGLPIQEERPRVGVIIGMEFDWEATNFHLRWHLHNEVQVWKTRLDMSDDEAAIWLESLRDALGPPLTATRTLGALGGIVASRIAREFRFGGPSYVVSAESASGLKALEIGLRSLQQNETDAVLVGAIDLAGDVRNVITTLQGTSPTCPCIPGEGAAALVLKRLDQAVRDGDRIYSVIRGIGNASGGGLEMLSDSASQSPCLISLERVFQDANIPRESVSFIETSGSENLPPQEFFTSQKSPCAIGSVTPNIGNTGAAAGLASVVKTSLCLYQEMIPPLEKEAQTALGNTRSAETGNIHLPAYPQFWMRNRADGPRRACVSATTFDGNCTHAILEGVDYTDTEPAPKKVVKERKRPLGLRPFGLFIVDGDDKNELIRGLDALLTFHFSLVTSHSSLLTPIESLARDWYRRHRLSSKKKHAVSIVAGDVSQLEKQIAAAKDAVLSDTPQNIRGSEGVCYTPNPLGESGEIAFVFPGSGNHYVGMGRDIGIHWPEVLRKMDAETSELKTQLIPDCYVPWRASWEPGWEKQAHEKIISDPLNMIFGQVAHGGLVANLVRHFGVKPSAVIGYSLGESAGLFAMGAWPERGEMLKRMQNTNLFRTELAGPCDTARKAWDIPQDQEVNWCAAVVNRSADAVRDVIAQWPFVRLLIINTPDECVIGGQKEQVDAAISALGCKGIFLEGVVTVHCDAAAPVADAYKALHVFPTTLPEGIRFYSCALGRSYELTSENAANSILQQALSGFDFPATIKQMYADGVRIFLEMGPQASCTRMITRILDSKPHRAVSACVRGEDDYLALIKFLGTLVSERVRVDLDQLYGDQAYAPEIAKSEPEEKGKRVTVMIGGNTPKPSLAKLIGTSVTRPAEDADPSEFHQDVAGGEGNPPASSYGNTSEVFKTSEVSYRQTDSDSGDRDMPVAYPAEDGISLFSDLIPPMTENMEATAEAHKQFLDFSDELTRSFGETFALQTQLLEYSLQGTEGDAPLPFSERNTPMSPPMEDFGIPEPAELLPEPSGPPPAFPREMCMEFAIGSVGKVLGPEFAIVGTYDVRVRLPDEPLMLVDRILSVEGEKGSLGSGRVVTEHDVFPDAWYLDGDRAPVCISVEAGQADLFLCSYLGIDLAVKGKRAYRLLDATVTFHRGLPRPGDVIRYEIEIEKFVRQGETYLFFFSFEGFIGESHLITMRDGCAGFFTEEEVRNSGGILLTEEDSQTVANSSLPTSLFSLLTSDASESCDDAAVDALRRGDLAGCFGPEFEGVQLAESLWLPKGRMRLLDRVLLLDTKGGRYGQGIIRGEADIRPDKWFLTCHFVDDMVMPGTLMYECCAHTLRIFLQRMGWITDKPGVCYEPMVGVESVLKCRGPVTPKTRHVIYEVEIRKIEYGPEPFVIADAMMYADGRRIVKFKDMSMKMTGVTQEEIEALWRENQTPKPAPRFDRDSILAFCEGKPSEAFGEPYLAFDSERTIARLPRPPYFFMDRVTQTEPEAWALAPGGWITAEYDMPRDAWYFTADRSGVMPFCILLEIALQPCGWLAAYMGSALRSENDLKFRNLGGSATLYHNILPDAGTLTMRSRLTSVSEAGDMIIEHFDMQVLQGDTMIYEGNTYFGFFTKTALADQVGIRGAKEVAYEPSSDEMARGVAYVFENEAPLSPDDSLPAALSSAAPELTMPAKALLMIDEIEMYVPDGGPAGLGFIRGIKQVDPEEWFFKAHFYQDPVCPGSLGIESFLQLMKFMAMDRWPHLRESHRFEMVTETPHNWVYRGQIIQTNQKVEVDAVVMGIQDEPVPTIFASGYLKVDGLFIYQMEDFGIRLIPNS